MPDGLFAQLDLWWNHTAEQRPGIQDVLGFLKQYGHGSTPAPTPSTRTSRSIVSNADSSGWAVPEDSALLDALLSIFPNERERLSGLVQETYTGCLLYILIDE